MLLCFRKNLLDPTLFGSNQNRKKVKKKSIYSYLTRVTASKKLINYSKTSNLMTNLDWRKKEKVKENRVKLNKNKLIFIQFYFTLFFLLPFQSNRLLNYCLQIFVNLLPKEKNPEKRTWDSVDSKDREEARVVVNGAVV